MKRKATQKLTLSQAMTEREGKAHARDEAIRISAGTLLVPSYLPSDERMSTHPTPYSPRYYERFLHLLFGAGIVETDLYRHLAADFVGDDADAFYIESLFIRAAKHGLFEEGAATVFIYPLDPLSCGSISTAYWKPGTFTPEALQSYLESNYFNSTWIIYYGRQANKARRRLVRRWLEIRADELAEQDINKLPEPAAKDKQSEVQAADLPTLAEICKGEDQAGIAELITTAFQSIAEAGGRPVSERPAVAVGVFRTAEYVGFIRPTSNKEWKAVLEKHWQLDGINTKDKYQIGGACNPTFIRIVQEAYKILNKTHDDLKKLPRDYR